MVLLATALAAVAAAAAPPPNCSAVALSARVDCGHPGITASECVAKAGCCYDGRHGSRTVPSCFYASPPACEPKACSGHPGRTYCPSDPAKGQCDKPPRKGGCPPGPCGARGSPPNPPPPPAFTKNIKTVHVVQSCHLDVGFADTCAGIVNRYFDKFYLDVIETAANLTSAGGDAQLTFLTHPYLISLYMDCPSYPGLHCPDAASKAKVQAALKAGTIWLQGFPHSGEPETFDEGTLTAALEFSRNVSLANGVTPSKAYSQRDVPGITRGVVPVFAKNGIEIVSIGSNGANEAPDLPGGHDGHAPVFRWHVGGAEVFVLWHRAGYGGDKVTDCHIADDEALCPDWVGDNGGARSQGSVIANFAAIQKEYPNSKVQTSTFDAFLPALKRANASGTLPVLTEEVGDTWVRQLRIHRRVLVHSIVLTLVVGRSTASRLIPSRRVLSARCSGLARPAWPAASARSRRWPTSHG